MMIKLQNRCRDIYREASRQQKRVPLSTETVVPDTREDLRRIAAVIPVVVLKSKEQEGGVVRVTGSVDATVMTIPEGAERLESLEVSCPFELEYDAPEGAEVQTQIRLRVVHEEARLLNPRKLSLGFEVLGDLICWRRESLVLQTQPEREESGLHLLEERIGCKVPVLVTEKSFTLHEELPLKELGEAELLLKESRIELEKIEALGSRAIVKGKIFLRALGWDAAAAALRETSASSPFSQIVECGEEQLEDFSAWVLQSSAYYDEIESISGGKCLDAEIHAVLQLSAFRAEELCLVTDAYSNRMPLEPETSRLRLSDPGEPRLRTLRLAEPLKLPENAELLGVHLEPLQAEAGRDGIRVSGAAQLLVREQDGALSVQRRALSASSEAEGEKITLDDWRLVSKQQDADLLQIAVELCLREEKLSELEIVSALSLREEDVYDQSALPALTLARADSGSLWELARRFHSSVESIEALNPEPEGMLLIVRERLEEPMKNE